MIDKDEIQKLSQLSRIGVEKNEFEALRENLNKILDFVAKLKELQLPDSLESGRLKPHLPGLPRPRTFCERTRRRTRQASIAKSS
jgi:hypothetical protein